MKKLFYILIVILMITLIGCSKPQPKNEPLIPTNPVITERLAVLERFEVKEESIIKPLSMTFFSETSNITIEETVILEIEYSDTGTGFFNRLGVILSDNPETEIILDREDKQDNLYLKKSKERRIEGVYYVTLELQYTPKKVGEITITLTDIYLDEITIDTSLQKKSETTNSLTINVEKKPKYYEVWGLTLSDYEVYTNHMFVFIKFGSVVAFSTTPYLDWDKYGIPIPVPIEMVNEETWEHEIYALNYWNEHFNSENADYQLPQIQ